MGYENLHDLFVLLGFLGVPSVIGTMLLGARYLGILKGRDFNRHELKLHELELRKLEIEIAARNADLREKELDIEAKRLAFDIQSLEQRENEQKKLT